MNAIAVLSLVLLLRQLSALRRLTKDTTAEAARYWMIAAVLLCLCCVVAQWAVADGGDQLKSAIQYFSAVMLLTPSIAILGARRPGANAWPWFVVLPLVLILQWPAVSQFMSENAGTAIEIPAPTMLGFVVVLVMGAGNYFGTINTGAAVFAATGTLLIAIPVSEWVSFDNEWCLVVGCLLLTFASVLLPGRYQEADTVAACDGGVPSRLWTDFRDIYGIVWAKRVMDRVNQFGERESWPVRLSLDGFVQISDGTLAKSVTSRPIEILCWILRRFVDRPFLRRYLPDEMTSENRTLLTDAQRENGVRGTPDDS